MDNNFPRTPRRDKVYMDFIRILAIFFVVYNHTAGFYFLSCNECASFAYWGLLLQNEVVKMAVPLFLMVSGGLLLNKEESIRELLNKRIVRFGVATILCGLVQYGFWLYWEDKECSILFYFKKLYSGMGDYNKFFASWFLYAYMGLLLLLPVLRAIAKALPNHAFFYLLGVQITLCCIIPLLFMSTTGDYYGYGSQVAWTLFRPHSPFHPYSAGYCAFYVLMGYFLEHRVSLQVYHQQRRKWWLAAILCLVFGAVCMWGADSCQGKKVLHQSVIYLTAFLPIPCAVLFMTFKEICASINFRPIPRNIIASLGGAVFTVMCIENLFRVKWGGIYAGLLPEINRVPAALVFTAAIWGAALLVGLIIKRIPIINRIF